MAEENTLYHFGSGKGSWGTRLQRLENGAQRLQNNVLRTSKGPYRRIPAAALDANQDLILTSPTVKKRGGVPPTANTSGFAYTSTDHSITWYWDGTNGSRVIVLHRADSSNFTIPISGSGLTISGLTASTTYYFLPFWNPVNVCNIGWVLGTVGTPQIAFLLADTTDVVNTQQYLIQQQNQVNEALTSGFMTAVTAAGGGSGGGGGGGGGSGGRCVMAGTEIETVGDFAYDIDIEGNFDWVHLQTSTYELYCTESHELYHAEDGKITAGELTTGDRVITDQGEQELVQVERVQRKCSLWRVRMKKGHLYWANGFLSHNKVDTR